MLSKRKDRLNTNYRYCPICGRKTVVVSKRKKIFQKEKAYINCYTCENKIRVEVRNHDYTSSNK